MIRGYLEGLEEYKMPFTFENNLVTIIPEKDMFTTFKNQYSPKKFDIIRGIDISNYEIYFFGCTYYGSTLTQKGYLKAIHNLTTKPIKGFHKLSFIGKPVDNFYIPKTAYSTEDFEAATSNKRMPIIKPKTWDETIKQSDTIIDDQKIIIELSFSAQYNSRFNERAVGDFIPHISLIFENEQEIEKLTTYYLYMLDFFSFISFRKGIEFEQISLYEENQKKFEKKAIAHFYTENSNRNINFKKCIDYRFIQENLGQLFQNIALRRNKTIFDNMFIPKDDKENSTVDHLKFLSCALSFEGEYKRSGFETKTILQAKFRDIKKLTSQVIKDIEKSVINEKSDDFIRIIKSSVVLESLQRLLETKGQQGVSNKETGYIKKMIDEIEKIDFSLEEKFNNTFELFYEDILKDYVMNLIHDNKLEKSKLPMKQYGYVFAELRNQIGHGFPPEKLERKHVFVYLVARAMIYILILDKAGIKHEVIKKIIYTLFDR